MTDKPEERVWTAAERLNLIEEAKAGEVIKRRNALAMDLYFKQAALAALHRQQTIDWILGKTMALPVVPKNGASA